ncbi:AsmA family protein [Rhodobacteraceae bacterium 2376]|uniref:AsmA family protein n=1 Tax=Rhabdonatronobacter sediminivivens TaxID=2743469 RepID=A0A7Z0HYA8_9RHOB|nr:AsmA family protein [Rhabdonatronobacter sediminivivens]NYS24287.1 AsmA family protein [Rhabdonatronobacter sediminivivens]
MRWIFRFLGVLASIAVLALLALFLIPTERIAVIAAERFQAATGRALSIEGAVRPSIYPLIGVRMEAVTLANAPWSEAGPMLQAEGIDVGLDVAALWAGDIVIRRLELRAPRLLLERAADGQENWQLAPAGDGGGAGGSGQPGREITLDLAEISDGQVIFRDHGTGTGFAASGLDLDLRLPDPAREATLRGRGVVNGQDVTLDLTLARPRALLEGQVSAVTLRAEGAGARLGFDGRMGVAPMSAEGQLDLDVPSAQPALALLGLAGVELPTALVPLRVSGQLTRSAEGSLHLREGALALGPNRMRGALDLRPGSERPHLTAQLAADALDLRAFGGAPGGGGGGAPGWSRAPLNLAALGGVDAEISLTAPSVETGIVRLDQTRLGLRLDNARAVFDLRELRLFDGVLTGEFVLNGRGSGSVGGDLRAADVALLPFLRDLAGFERLQGQGNMQLRFLGVGDSLHAIMTSLSGEGRIDLGQGEIIGLDLAGMLRNLDLGYMGEGARTIYDSISGSFTMEGGVLRNDDLRLTASRLDVTGRGTVGLGERVLNYRVTPEAMRDPETGQALRVPVLITGPWEAPRFRLDLEGLAQDRLREEQQRLEEIARDEARRREQDLRDRAERALQERLGVERGAGESLEDAARRRLEQEIGRGLGRLLGGD